MNNVFFAVNTKPSFCFVTLVMLISLVLLPGCSTTSDVISDRGIQKRKYRCGFYVSNQNTPTIAAVHEVHPALIHPNALDEEHCADLASMHLELVSQTELATTHTSDSETAHLRSANHTKYKLHNQTLSIGNQAANGAAHPAVQAENPKALPVILAEKQNSRDDSDLLIMIALCILLPPLAVFLLHGISTHFWISILLTCLFWVPGIIYALYLTITVY